MVRVRRRRVLRRQLRRRVGSRRRRLSVATALSLDGAENVILPGVYHGANIGDPWYGSPDVIDAWSSHCLP